MVMTKNSVSIGNSGEYFVAGELERRGFTVALPMANVKDFDLLAINRDTHEQFAIQVKTTIHNKKSWPMNKKNEDLIGTNILYFLVYLNGTDMPEYHIVPSAVVADTIRRSHQKWLREPGINGQPHNDNTIRVFKDEEDLYKDRWDLLNI